MKSGLEGRNNEFFQLVSDLVDLHVSMKSGLEGRNNLNTMISALQKKTVSMKSGLEGRNNSLRTRGHFLKLPSQ